MATGGHETASDEIPDVQCLSCASREVEKYCVECKGYCCKKCLQDHTRFPIMKSHTLLDKSSFKGSELLGKQEALTPGQLVLPMVPTENCDVHHIKILDMYCADHDEVGCTTCMALKHRSCNSIHSIPDEIDQLFQPAERDEVCKNLQESALVLRDIGKKREKLLKELIMSKDEAYNIIKDERNTIVEAVDNLERRTLEKVDTVYQTIKRTLEKESKSVTVQVDGIQRISDGIKTSAENKAQQFVCVKEANKKIDEVKKNKVLLQKEMRAKIRINVKPDILDGLRNMETFGIVDAVTETAGVYTVEKCRNLDVSLLHDSSTCRINDSCWTDDGSSLLLVDNANKKLQRVNMETEKIDGYCNFDFNPYRACCIGKDEAVVTFYRNSKFVQFVHIGKQLKPLRKIQIDHDCLGIAYKENKLYIADNAKTIYVHDMAGNQLHTVSSDSNGNSLFSTVRNITFSADGNWAFVTDWTRGVIILDNQLRHVSSFKDPEMTSASDVCTDNRGNIFVCGYTSHNVLQIGYDGIKRGVIASQSDELQWPYSVCFHSSKRQLIVTQSNTIIKIFPLKKLDVQMT